MNMRIDKATLPVTAIMAIVVIVVGIVMYYFDNKSAQAKDVNSLMTDVAILKVSDAAQDSAIKDVGDKIDRLRDEQNRRLDVINENLIRQLQSNGIQPKR